MKQFSGDIENRMARDPCPEDDRNQLGFAERGTAVPQQALTRAFIREESTQVVRNVFGLPIVTSQACRKRLACSMET